MLNLVLRSAEVRNGDIIVAEVRSDGIITEWGDSNPKLGQGWALSGTTLTNTKTKRRVVFYPDDDRKYRVLRPVVDEPPEWGEMAL